MYKQAINEMYVDQYNKGASIWQIANDNDDSYKNVFESITGHRFESRMLPDNEKDKICDLYLDGLSTVKIGGMYGIGNKSIASVLSDRGIERDRTLSTRIYHLNEHYFDALDTPNKCYIFGFLLSDGNNNRNKSTVSISLQEEDREILEKMRLELNSDKQLEYLDYSNKHDFGYNYKNQYRLLLFSSKLCDALSSHGLIPNKSLILEFPQDVPKEYISHMVRGMWDGDGTLGIYNNIVNLSLTATKMFCEGLQRYLLDNLNIKSSIYDARCHNGITKILTINSNADKLKVLNWMYIDAELFLERKYNKYLQIKSFLESKIA